MKRQLFIPFLFLFAVSMVFAHPYDEVDWKNAKAPKGCFNSSGAIWCEKPDRTSTTVTRPDTRMQYFYVKVNGGSAFTVSYCKDLITIPTIHEDESVASINSGKYERFYEIVTEALITGDYNWTCMGERKIKEVYCYALRDRYGNYEMNIRKYDEFGILDSEKRTTTAERDYCKKLLDAVE